mgnify:CR=1 FL=1
MKGVESHRMNNIEFIATYIFNNPGARRMEIIRALMVYKWGKVGTDIVVRGWGSVYFTDYRCFSGRYRGKLWKKVNEKKNAGYVLLEGGLRYVVA